MVMAVQPVGGVVAQDELVERVEAAVAEVARVEARIEVRGAIGVRAGAPYPRWRGAMSVGGTVYRRGVRDNDVDAAGPPRFVTQLM